MDIFCNQGVEFISELCFELKFYLSFNNCAEHDLLSLHMA